MLSPAPGPRPGFGVALPTSGPFATAANIIAVAERAEASGYDEVWVNDHYSYPRSRIGRSSVGSIEATGTADPNFFESLTTLAVVGGRVPRIGLAVHSLVLPLRDPRLLAKQLSAMHALVDRRLIVAPGIGSSQEDFRAAGIPFEMRGRMMDEYLRVLDAISNHEHPVSFDGRFVSFRDGTFYPLPRGIDLWITGDGETALRRAVRWGTGWFSSWWPSLAEYERLLRRLDELAVEAGRDPETIERGSDPFVCIADTRDEALAVCARTLTARYGTLEHALAVSAVGSPADVRDHLRALLRLGCTSLELRFICHDLPALLAAIERVAAEVLPDLRREFGPPR